MGGNGMACCELLSRLLPQLGNAVNVAAEGRKRLTFLFYAYKNTKPTTALPSRKRTIQTKHECN